MRVVPATRRYMELPRYLRVADGAEPLAELVRLVAADLGFGRLLVVSGSSATRATADALARELGPLAAGREQVADNSQAAVDALLGSSLAHADAVLAVGGGKTIDVAKLACEAADMPIISVPTQLTADGIASPVSVIEHDGRGDSRRARLPIAVLVDLDVIAASPVATVRAGVGDLIANSGAIADWRLAEAAGRESVDDFAALLAQTATDAVFGSDVTALGAGSPSRPFLARLLEGLVLSGLAMEIAGSSRPCSGSEHLFSHALDRIHPGTAMHGEQVAFGAVVTAALQGRDWRALLDFLRAAGMARSAAGFGFDGTQLVELLEAAPATREGRYTVLDEVDRSQLHECVRAVLAAPA